LSDSVSGAPADWHQPESLKVFHWSDNVSGDPANPAQAARLAGANGARHLACMLVEPAECPSVDDPTVLVTCVPVTRLDLVLGADPRLDTGFDLGARLRGAWGHALRRMALEDPEAARALALFFPDKSGPSGHAPPPYRLSAIPEPDGLRVRLSLIGFAGRWRRAAFDALVAALTEPPGLRLDYRRDRQLPLRLLSADWTRTEGVEVPPPPPVAVLHLCTPLRLGPRGVLGTSFDDILVGLAERAALTSPWLGLRFTPNLSLWRDRARSLGYRFGGLRPVVWDTWSSVNGRDRAAGYLGQLEITGTDESVMALLAVGTILHAGGGPSKGYGRYELYSSPF
jgi:hypothetical protein